MAPKDAADGSLDREPRVAVRRLIEAIDPLDSTEAEHRADALAWVAGPADIFRRTSSPTRPRKHLVSYFLLMDSARELVLLGDHIKSGLWLPSGGHVEPDEHPVETARRECLEELGLEAVFHPDTGEQPLFITVTETVPGLPDPHRDVSLWFLLAHDSDVPLTVDPREYHGIRWWAPDEIRAADPNQFDPHMSRMLAKATAQTTRVSR